LHWKRQKPTKTKGGGQKRGKTQKNRVSLPKKNNAPPVQRDGRRTGTKSIQRKNRMGNARTAKGESQTTEVGRAPEPLKERQGSFLEREKNEAKKSAMGRGKNRERWN